MSLAKVAHGAVPAPPELRNIDIGINAFLGDHIAGLRGMTSKRKTAPGKFIESEPERLFRDLYLGSDEAFLSAAEVLTKRLVTKMDGRTADGLLICLRARDDQEQYGGALKLQVVAEHAAVLEELESGDVNLSAVTDLLDKPGELQKGALRASWLADDRVLIGDQLAQDSTYFPAAFGIRTFARASSSLPILLAAIDAIDPELTPVVAEACRSVQSGEVDDVIDQLEHRLPEVARIRPDIMHALESQGRPVARIDTAQRVTEVIKAGQITISGPIADMRKYVQMELNDGQESGVAPGLGRAQDPEWVVWVECTAEPRRSHR